ncbi:MAG: hydrogenase 2 operon protein HybA [Magnetovibrionaceae bacterium]
MDRRSFLRNALVGTASAGAACATATLGSDSAEAGTLFDRGALDVPPKAVGMIYDSTLCIGCQACVAACKDANDMSAAMPKELAGWNEGTWDTPRALSGDTLNIIQAYVHGTADTKDREENGFAFVKRHCLHCVDPSCVSVCPVGAMAKDAEDGIVSHDPDRCIGCRYCMIGCPFGIPKYEYNDAKGEIKKCQLCNHKQAEGDVPACVDVCPTGASLFGDLKDLEVEIQRRLAMTPGTTYSFPRGDISGKLGGGIRPGHDAPAATYQSHVYGEKEVGSTQVRYLSAVTPAKLGLPELPEESFARRSEGMQHTLYKGMIAPFALLVGLVGLAWRSANKKDQA